MTAAKEIKESMKKNKIVIGVKGVIKCLKKGTLKTAIHSSNIPPALKKEMDYYSGISKAEVKPFGGDSVRLGQICGRPFRILAVGIRK
jgi:large subunit ribosomal protein L30e